MGRKKGPPKNAYYFLMEDYRNEQQARGRKITMKEAAEEVKDIWPNLDEADKERYREMANRDRANKSKCNSLGMPFELIDKEQMSKEEAKLAMDRIIRDTVQHLLHETTLRTKYFHVIHVNYFVETDEGEFIPAEVAIAKFSLGKGVVETFHRFLTVRQGRLPCGYLFKAREFTGGTHKTLFEMENGEDDMNRLLNDIKRFLKPDGVCGELPPLYTMPDNLNTNTSTSAVKCMLRNLCDNYGDDVRIFNIYVLAKLFYELRNACAKDELFPSQTIAESELDKDMYNYTRGIACQYHEDEDVMQFCSLSIVQRWVFLICDHCCPDLGVDLVPGLHCPQSADVKGRYRRVWTKSRHSDDVDEDDYDKGTAAKPISQKPVSFISAAKSEVESKPVSSSPGDGEPVRPGFTSWSAVANHNAGASKPPTFNENNYPSIGGGGGRGRNSGTRSVDHNAWSGRGRASKGVSSAMNRMNLNN